MAKRVGEAIGFAVAVAVLAVAAGAAARILWELASWGWDWSVFGRL